RSDRGQALRHRHRAGARGHGSPRATSPSSTTSAARGRDEISPAICPSARFGRPDPARPGAPHRQSAGGTARRAAEMPGTAPGRHPGAVWPDIMMKNDIAPLGGAALAFVTLLWLGLLLGVSFLATPVKFAAPTLTLAVALDVGRVTFGLFS